MPVRTMPQHAGFTLPELMVCLALFILLSLWAAPNLTSLLTRSQSNEALNRLVSTVQYARSTAVALRNTVTVCPGTVAQGCQNTAHWSNTLLVFIDSNQNGTQEAGELLLQAVPIANEHYWHWANFRNKKYLQYQADGSTPGLNGTFTLCQAQNALGQVVINSTGRIRSEQSGNATHCANL